jgi:cytochrome c biogenesis protein CcmG, thiol:disulfide interchange protein DsbE
LIRIVLVLLPLLVLAGLVAVFALTIDRDPQLVRSVLIGKAAPEFTLDPVPGIDRPGFDTQSLGGTVTLVNVFASWCVPCRDEHPHLVALQRSGVRIFGINQKDRPENAARFLDELGNPYDAVGGDINGRVSIEWGVYGVPETFVVDAGGTITFKHVGPINEQSLRDEVMPAIEAARGG